jgi:hypothetical protein
VRRFLACLFGVLALTLAAGACSSDSKNVEDEVKRVFKDTYDLTGVSVSCPDDAKAEEGQKFECEVEKDGEKGTVGIEFTSDKFFEIGPPSSGDIPEWLIDAAAGTVTDTSDLSS